MMVDLELVDTGDLVEQLLKRCDNGAILLDVLESDERGEYRTFFKGCKCCMVNMLDFVSAELKEEIEAESLGDESSAA
jgi:hypothetical protein